MTKLGFFLKHSCVFHTKAVGEDLSNIFESHAFYFWIAEIHRTIVMSAWWYNASIEGQERTSSQRSKWQRRNQMHQMEWYSPFELEMSMRQ